MCGRILQTNGSLSASDGIVHVTLVKMRILFVSLTICLVTSSVSANTFDSATISLSPRPNHDPWRVNWLGSSAVTVEATTARPLVVKSFALEQNDTQPVHAAAVEHSNGYLMRAKIHRIASFATLPLFATELALGQSLYNGTDTGWKKGMHGVVGAGIVGLFGVNTLTGAWNLFGEGWKDPGHGRRLLHGLLMMAADAGFVATTASTPSEHRGLSFSTDRSTHRNLALTSIGLGTAGYLVMLIGNH